MNEVRNEIQALVEAPELRDAFYLVIANKQDLPNAMPPREVSERLQLPQIMASRLWTCLPGELGNEQLMNAHFDWISSALRHAFDKAKQTQGPSGAHVVAAPSSFADAPTPATSTAAVGPSSDGLGSVSSSGSSRGLDVLERWLQVEDEPDDEFIRVDVATVWLIHRLASLVLLHDMIINDCLTSGTFSNAAEIGGL
ncbi:hypothetical protein Vretimale_3762 [Volvox reticuliferus]|nr:hypothetical protein Vretimale_3762 [Volvox reticuliferus]